MTNVLPTFVEVYTMTITSSNFEDLTLPSILIFPAIHMMRFMSQQSLWAWLPEPKLYSFQVRADAVLPPPAYIYCNKSVIPSQYLLEQVTKIQTILIEMSWEQVHDELSKKTTRGP